MTVEKLAAIVEIAEMAWKVVCRIYQKLR